MRKSVIVLLSVCAITSCGKGDVEPQGFTGGEREKVAVVDGVLHFATTGDYFRFQRRDGEQRPRGAQGVGGAQRVHVDADLC